MNPSDNNNESQRFTPYRAVIPFYILYDLDLNANHLRLYGQIEQMESNPDPKVNATFSYAWLGEQLGINRRNAMKMAKVLIDKGYIEHTEVKKGKYIWNTKKKPIIIQDEDEGCLPETPPQCLPETPPSVSQRHPKIPEEKIPESKKTPYVLFEEFWKLFPTKKERMEALEVWKKNQLEGIGRNIIEKLKIQIEKDEQWIRGFNPHAPKYLRRRLWEDEIAKPKVYQLATAKPQQPTYDDNDTNWKSLEVL
jgi:hypothetical protein